MAIVDEGKHADALRRTLRELGTGFAANTDDADVLVIGTLSPGPMLDARQARSADPRPVIIALATPRHARTGPDTPPGVRHRAERRDVPELAFPLTSS